MCNKASRPGPGTLQTNNTERYMGFPKSRGTLSGAPIIWIFNILGSILGSPLFRETSTSAVGQRCSSIHLAFWFLQTAQPGLRQASQNPGQKTGPRAFSNRCRIESAWAWATESSCGLELFRCQFPKPGPSGISSTESCLCAWLLRCATVHCTPLNHGHGQARARVLDRLGSWKR